MTPFSLQPTPAAPNGGPNAKERKTGSNGQATSGAKATSRPAANGHRRNRASRRTPSEIRAHYIVQVMERFRKRMRK